MHCEYRCLQRPEEGVRAPGDGVIGRCEPLVLLGIELWFSARVANILNLYAICLASYCCSMCTWSMCILPQTLCHLWMTCSTHCHASIHMHTHACLYIDTHTKAPRRRGDRKLRLFGGCGGIVEANFSFPCTIVFWGR